VKNEKPEQGPNPIEVSTVASWFLVILGSWLFVAFAAILIAMAVDWFTGTVYYTEKILDLVGWHQ
jgi:hypothetical protein